MNDKPSRCGIWRVWSMVATVLLAGSVGLIGWQWGRKQPAGPAFGQSLNGLPASAPARTTFRVATYNIHSAKGADGKTDLGRIAENLRGADLAGLNEVRGEAMVSQLGKNLSMQWLFCPSERQFGSDYFGNGLLCRLPVISWQRLPLPRPPESNATFQSALLLRFKHQDRPVNLLLAHVTLRAYRQEQLQCLADLFLSLEPPAILIGDMNTTQDDPVLSALLHTPGVTAATAATPTGPEHRIDWIITRGLDVAGKGFVERGASDHPLVWADLEIAKDKR